MTENSALTGWMPAAEPFLGPLRTAARDFTALTGVPVDIREELSLRARSERPERAERSARLGEPGRTSAGGSCHLVRAADGWAAVNLARADDLASVPALLRLLGPDRPPGAGPGGDPAAALRRAAARVPAADVACRAQLLGIAAASLGADRGTRPPVLCTRHGEPAARPPAGVRVVDLSALWAGPLCARLLGLAGAEVTKVESSARPDAARCGPPGFYRRLHDGHRSLVLDFAGGALHRVLDEADVVIEASRPRALRRFGVHAEEFLAARPGRAWVSITGYGRDDARIAFGDDAAVAGGLVAAGPAFLGDAIADPVTGILAAEAAARSLADGGGHLLCVSMAACAAALVP